MQWAKVIAIVSVIAACGQPSIDTTTDTGGVTDTSARLSVDLTSVIHAICRQQPLSMHCARACYKEPELDFCPALDTHCEAPPDEDIAFCEEWRAKRQLAR